MQTDTRHGRFVADEAAQLGESPGGMALALRLSNRAIGT